MYNILFLRCILLFALTMPVHAGIVVNINPFSSQSGWTHAFSCLRETMLMLQSRRLGNIFSLPNISASGDGMLGKFELRLSIKAS